MEAGVSPGPERPWSSGPGAQAESPERKEHVAADARRRVGTVVGGCARSLQTVVVVSVEQ